MRTTSWVLLALTALFLVSSLWRREQYRRRGEPLPWQFAGNIAGWFGTACFFGAILVPHGTWFWALLSASVTLNIVDVIAWRRARKRLSGAIAT